MTTITAKEIINKIQNAKSMKDIFPDLANWKDVYKEYLKVIHPDVCKELHAQDASNILNKFKLEFEKGKTHEDEAGIITYKIDSVNIKGDKSLIKTSVDRYKFFMKGTDPKSKNFQKYLPIALTEISNTEIEFKLKGRAMPLSSIGTLPEHHVHWIFSRLLEFAAYMNQAGYVHAGINPDSIYVYPEGHGIVCISFYHSMPVGSTMKTICGQYEHFYPASLLSHKKATTDIDIELAKRTAVYLLGDRSGLGVKLKKINTDVILNFLFSRHDDPREAFFEYRKILESNFKRKFHELNI